MCGHADAIAIAEQDDVRREVELLWHFHEHRLRPGTPTARLRDRVAFSEHAPLRLVRCVDCGTVYRNPVERTFELTEIYARDVPPDGVLASLHETQLDAQRAQAVRLREVMGGGGSGLEVGSYAGAFLAAARAESLNFEGLDINPAVNRFTRSLGFAVHDGTLETFAADRRFDAVAIWNTFDQLAEPRAAVIASRAVLNPGGVLAIRVPNGAFYAAWAPVARGAGPRAALARELLAQNNLLSFPYRAGFTPSSLEDLLRQCGFDVARAYGDVLVPIADEWTRRWARVEELMVKRALGTVSHRRADAAPWFEIYARRR
ncbi:MAG TPA: methyltransferase domain-containing protein [Gemmatimonadaceae bacterium]|nr:methyltransferase domain-containing protein [Gemmatimonadaceae bacterium]